MAVIVSVKRDREDRTSTTTLHEHEFKRADRAQHSRWAFFNILTRLDPTPDPRVEQKSRSLIREGCEKDRASP